MATVEELILAINARGGSATVAEIRSIRQALNQLARETESANRNTQNFGMGLQNVGRNITSVGRTLTNNVTKNILKVGVGAIKAAADFDAGMSKVQAISGATGKDMDSMRGKARQLGRDTIFTASESADAFKYMAMAGWKTNDMLEGIDGVMDLAAASGEDLSLVTDIVTDAMTAFGLEAKQSAQFADLLASVSSNSNTNIAMLGESFKYVAPIAGTAGYAFEDIGMALGLMANQGIKASQAGTSLRGGITNLIKPTKDGAAWIDRLKINVKDANGNMLPFKDTMDDLRTKFKGLNKDQQIQAATAIFGKTAMAGMLAVINASPEEYAKLSGATSEYSGKAKDMAAIMRDNLNGQLKLLKSALSDIGIEIGEILMPYIESFVKWLQSLAKQFSGLSPHAKKLIVIFALIAGAIGPVVLVIGTLVTAIGAISTAISVIGAPVLGIIAGIAALVIIIGSLILKFVSFETILETIQNGFNAFKNVLTFIGNFLVSVFTPVIQALQRALAQVDTAAMADAWEKLKTSVVALLPLLQLIGQIIGVVVAVAVGALIGLVNGLVASFGNVVAVITGLVSIVANVFGLIWGIISGNTDMIKQNWDLLWQNILSVLVNAGLAIWNYVAGFIDGIVSFFQGLYDTIVGHSIIPDLVNAVIGWFNTLVETVMGVIKWFVNGVKSFFNTMKNGVVLIWTTLKNKVVSVITNLASGVKNKVSQIVSSVKSKFNTAKSIAINAWNSIKSKVTSIVSGMVSKVKEYFGKLVSGIKSKVSSAKSAAKSVANGVKDAITGVAKNAYKWGSNLIGGFIKGIKSKIGAVGKAAGSVVGAAKNKLGFHSPAKEGPGKDADTWAPNLMDMFVEGLKNKIGAVENISELIASKLNWASVAQRSNPSIVNNNSNKNASIIINGATMTADEIGNAVVSKLQIAGIRSQKG
jgi:TP901 family phage tail tape measure protein